MGLFPGFVQQKFTTKEGIAIHFLKGGIGPPLLLLHGYPQTHAIWHRIAPFLTNHYTLVIPDLRGYGDSSKPHGNADHSTYSKREMAKDQLELMEHMSYHSYCVMGHDKGARVAHRMALDCPKRIEKLVLMDILPTLFVFKNVNKGIAEGYYHWFFLTQPNDLPERMIGANPQYYIRETLTRWCKSGLNAFSPLALEEYLRCSCTPEAIHAACEDYRAAATIDLRNDEADERRKIEMPLLVLWAKNGLMDRSFDVLKVWREWAIHVSGRPIDCGHFIPEEASEEIGPLVSSWLQERKT
jgi:haloacetate dehalogenase